MEDFLHSLKSYERIMIILHNNINKNKNLKELIENISNNLSSDVIILIKEDDQSKIVRRIMYPKNIKIRSVSLEQNPNTDIIIKGNPDFSILLSNDTPDDNLLYMYRLLMYNKKKFVIIDLEKSKNFLLKLNEDKECNENVKCNNIDNVKYNRYQQVIDDKYIETFKNTNEVINDLNLRMKSKKKSFPFVARK